jgi:hypothetical protein
MNKKANAAEAANVNDSEEVVDAKSTQVATVESTAVSTEVRVQGVQLDFPFIRIGQGMSQWRTAETKNGKPEEGAFYVGRSKDQNVKIAESGKDGGIYGIILDKVDGFKEDRPYVPGTVAAPRRWIVGQQDADGKPMSEEACLTAAAAEGFSLALKPTGEVWPDSGRPKMRANLGRFCYLLMLVPVPETLESDDLRVYPIGDRLYTTARMEFDKQYFKSLDQTLGNIKSRADFAFMQEQKKLLRDGKIDAEGYKKAIEGHRWSVNGLVCHIYSCEATNKQGITYTTHAFERAMRDGKPWEFTDEEKADFAAFLMSVKAGTASMDDVGDTEF